MVMDGVAVSQYPHTIETTQARPTREAQESASLSSVITSTAADTTSSMSGQVTASQVTALTTFQ